MITTFVILLIVAGLAVAAIAVIAALGAAGIAIVAAPISLLFSALGWLLRFCLKAGVVVGVVYLIYRVCRSVSHRG